MAEKRVLCSSCDIYCQVLVETDGDKVVRAKAADTRAGYANICMKGVHAPAGFNHEDRVLYPLKRVGERGSCQWEPVAWDGEMAIAETSEGRVTMKMANRDDMPAGPVRIPHLKGIPCKVFPA